MKNTTDYVLFIYHGLSEHSLKKADPTGCHCLTAPTCCNEPSLAHDTCYRFQCFATSRLIAEAAHLPPERCSSSFQSRHRHGHWLTPHTEDVLRALPGQGEKRVTALCPAFFCDGIETLEEVALRGRYIFQEAGGESFRVIPCLNDSPAAIQCMETLMQHAADWPEA